MAVRYCDGNCNQCSLMRHGNSRMLTYVLNKLHRKFGNGVYAIVQTACPNLTVCYDCRDADFCHDEGCELVEEEKEGDREMKLYVWRLSNGTICVTASSLEEAFDTAKEQLEGYEYDKLNGKYQVYHGTTAVSHWGE